ncbi:IclR family transcriptional regulator [Ramlibacter sp.]|uniref:IclR family transcriptional regulator n=1 Tax=Ramlibacter sp. TaxID=1917967 RepID=UPI003D126952
MSASAQAKNGATILTVSRGLHVLRAFRSSRSPLTNSELVRSTGLPKATVSRLTSTLLHLGFLRHVRGSREFELAAAPLGIGHAFIASSELLQVADPFLQELAERLGVSVALAVGDGLDMLYVAYRASHKVATLRLGVGSVLPMGTTSIGHAYLWGLPPEQRARQIEDLKKAAGSREAVMLRGMEESFSELFAGGACGVLGGYQRDAYGVAVPLRVGRDRTVMGLSCGKADVQPDLAAERKRIAPVLKNAATRLEELLAGFDGLP